MSEKGYGKLVAEELVRAVTRAVVYSIALLCIVNIVMGTLRQEAKEAMEYAAQTVPAQAIDSILSNPSFNQKVLPKIKQNAKEAIEYTVEVAGRKLTVSAAGKSKK